MTTAITAQQLFDTFEHSLGLGWLAGKGGADKLLLEQGHSNASLITYLNIIHPPLIQLIGERELAFLQGLGKNSLHDTLSSLFTHSAMVIVTNVEGLDPQAMELAEAQQIPLLTTGQETAEVISRLHYFLSRQFAVQETLHGVFMEVLGTGVLISGESGIGKSELALELITRGHRLIADDAPFFTRINPDVLNGTCPKLLCGFLEVRGLGILNIPAMFGDNAVKTNKNLKLIIHLQPASSFNHDDNDRIYGSVKERRILEVSVPQLTLPVAPGRNLAVLIEGAVRNHLLRVRGYNAADAFVTQHKQMLDTSNT